MKSLAYLSAGLTSLSLLTGCATTHSNFDDASKVRVGELDEGVYSVTKVSDPLYNFFTFGINTVEKVHLERLGDLNYGKNTNVVINIYQNEIMPQNLENDFQRKDNGSLRIE